MSLESHFYSVVDMLKDFLVTRMLCVVVIFQLHYQLNRDSSA